MNYTDLIEILQLEFNYTYEEAKKAIKELKNEKKIICKIQ